MQLRTHITFAVLLAIGAKWQIQDNAHRYAHYFDEDLDYCYHCFERQIDSCAEFHAKLAVSVEERMSVTDALLSLMAAFGSAKRNTAIMRLKHSGVPFIVAKHFGRHRPHRVLSEGTALETKMLMHSFIATPRVDGFQLCPEVTSAVPRLIAAMLQAQPNALHDLDDFTVLLHMLDNVQPLLSAVLYARGWPVPRAIARCGFTQYEAYAGKPLIYYYDAPDALKVDIARQLLRMALQFTEGFADFRLYITDMSADNLVYDEATRRLTLVDLDTLLVVDAVALALMQPTVRASTHRHDFIDCDNCFAYVPQDICTHARSDINVFSACQLLREDLQRNRLGGFLRSLLAGGAHAELAGQLDACVDCMPPKCWDRFGKVRAIIESLDFIHSQI